VAWLLTAGLTVGVRTLGRVLRAAGYVYKRVRRCLRAQRPSTRFRAAQRLLAYWQRQGKVLWYTDECRFSRQAPLSHAWQPRGQRAVGVPAVRGKGGYSMLGFWCPQAPAQATAPAFHYWTSETAFTAELWVKAVEDWLAKQAGPVRLVLDNASIHRARLVQERMAAWQQQGLHLFYLPPYSPELNRIEVLWHRFKHAWLAPTDYASEETLFQQINAIAQAIGTKYRITFG
jgi:transposase